MAKNKKANKKSEEVVKEKISDNTSIESNINVEKKPITEPKGKTVKLKCLKKINFGKLSTGDLFLFQTDEVRTVEYKDPYAYWIDWGLQHGFLEVVEE